MVKKIKLKFMFISVLSIFSVLAIVIATVNGFNYIYMYQSADKVLDILSINDGKFLDDFIHEAPTPFQSQEAKFETRFFSVHFDAFGRFESLNLTNISSIEEEEALEHACRVLSSGDERGFLENYRFLNRSTKTGRMILFLDCTRNIHIAQKFVNISVTVGIVSALIIVTIMYFVSSKILRPIVDSYNKQRKFISDAGHELKTPLTIIHANAEMLELEIGEDESINAIKKQIARLNQMTKNLATLSRADEIEVRKEMMEFSFSNACIDVIESLKKVAETKNKQLEYNIIDNINYKGSERLIRQLISLIVENAIKYSKEYINISVTKKHSKIIFEITNDTNGVEQGNLNHYCNRFYRSDDARASDIEGSGIGLSIANEIVLLHKADMKIYSEDGNKFTVKIVL